MCVCVCVQVARFLCVDLRQDFTASFELFIPIHIFSSWFEISFTGIEKRMAIYPYRLLFLRTTMFSFVYLFIHFCDIMAFKDELRTNLLLTRCNNQPYTKISVLGYIFRWSSHCNWLISILQYDSPNFHKGINFKAEWMFSANINNVDCFIYPWENYEPLIPQFWDLILHLPFLYKNRFCI